MAAPFFELAYAWLKSSKPGEDEWYQIGKAEEYAKNFQTGKWKIKRHLYATLQKDLSNQRLLIFIDQFEEVYTLCPEDERNIFIDQLLAIIAEREKQPPNIVLVITLRADFLGQAIDSRLGEVLQKFKFEMIRTMNQEELQSAIEKPAQAVGLTIQDGLTKIS